MITPRTFVCVMLASACTMAAADRSDRGSRREVDRTRNPRDGGDGDASPTGSGSCKSPDSLFKCVATCDDFVALTDLPVKGSVALSAIDMFGVTRGTMDVTIGSTRKVHANWNADIIAHVHDLPCDAAPPAGGGHWQVDPLGPADDTNEFWFYLDAAATRTAVRESSEQNNRVLVPSPTPSEYSARSVVVHDVDGTRLGCCTLKAC